MIELILASGSPRRHELLGRLLPHFRIVVSTVEETGSEALPSWEITPVSLPAPFNVPSEADPRLWAWRKALDARSTVLDDLERDTLILGADTVVVGPEVLLGKPTSREHAVQMLKLLRGREHYVVTGFALLQREGNDQPLHVEAVASRVVMNPYSDEELAGYVATGEPMDKAGAYALQGIGGKLVQEVEGCRTNVVGLPLCAVRRALLKAGVEVLPLPPDGYCPFCTLSIE